MRGALNQRSTATAARSISPQKPLLSKWTAVKPVGKQKHFLVIKVLPAEGQADAGTPEWVEIEAVYSNATKKIRWRDLLDESDWHRGWR